MRICEEIAFVWKKGWLVLNFVIFGNNNSKIDFSFQNVIVGLLLDGRLSVRFASVGERLQRFGTVLPGDLPAASHLGAVRLDVVLLLWISLPIGVPERCSATVCKIAHCGLHWVRLGTGVQSVLPVTDSWNDLSHRCAALVRAICGLDGSHWIPRQFAQAGIVEPSGPVGNYCSMDVAVGSDGHLGSYEHQVQLLAVVRCGFGDFHYVRIDVDCSGKCSLRKSSADSG